MPFANEHAARQVPPGTFERTSFKRKVVTNGVTIITGRVKGSEATSTASVRFDAKKFTPQRARKWLKDNGFKTDQFEVATGEVKVEESKEEITTDGEDCFRHDTLELSERTWRLDSQGFMHVGATLTTVGVYKYRDNNTGIIRREYRPASEVQSPRFLNSLKRCVVTNEHLPNKQPVTLRNVKTYQVGHVGDDITKDGLKVNGNLTLTDLRTVNDVYTGAKRGISIGYRCKTRYNPGVWDSPNGPIPYDYVQHGHLANHAAITGTPRGGLGNDGTSLHLDSLETELITEVKETTEMQTASITLNGMALSLPIEAAPIVKAELDRLDSELENKDTQLETLTTKVSELETDVEKLTKERDELKTDSEDAPNLNVLVKDRLEFLKSANVLVKEETLSKIDSAAEDYEMQVIDAALKEAGIDLEDKAKLHTDSKLFEVYKRSRFDGLIEGKQDDAHNELSAGVITTQVLSRTDSRKNDPDYRKNIRARLQIAQQKRDGTFVESRTA